MKYLFLFSSEVSQKPWILVENLLFLVSLVMRHIALYESIMSITAAKQKS